MTYRDLLRETVNGAALSRLKLKNNHHGIVKDYINDPLFFGQIYVVNHVLDPITFLMILGDTNKPRMDKVLYYVYKTDEHMDEHA